MDRESLLDKTSFIYGMGFVLFLFCVDPVYMDRSAFVESIGGYIPEWRCQGNAFAQRIKNIRKYINMIIITDFASLFIISPHVSDK